METIKMEDKDGNIKEYEVVVSFYSNKNKKHYLVYTDNKKDEDNNYVYYALSYNPYTVCNLPDRNVRHFLF